VVLEAKERGLSSQGWGQGREGPRFRKARFVWGPKGPRGRRPAGRRGPGSGERRDWKALPRNSRDEQAAGKEGHRCPFLSSEGCSWGNKNPHPGGRGGTQRGAGASELVVSTGGGPGRGKVGDGGGPGSPGRKGNEKKSFRFGHRLITPRRYWRVAEGESFRERGGGAQQVQPLPL